MNTVWHVDGYKIDTDGELDIMSFGTLLRFKKSA